MSVPVIDQARIQAQVLVPLVKALQAELGEARANAIVRNALGDLYRKLGERWARQKAGNLGDGLASAFDAFAAVDALEYDVIKQSREAYEINALKKSGEGA